MLVGLVLLSLPWIRHRMYEAFYHVHLWLAVSYVGLMFWHCKDLGDSWAYMWATLAVWLFSLFGRVFWYNRTTNLGRTMFNTSHVTSRLLPESMIQLEIDAPEGFEWHAGQHVYVRFLRLSPWDNHPFTIANVIDPNIPEGQRTLRFLIRPYLGFTRRLYHCLTNQPDMQLMACLDGPYGTDHGDVFSTYDTLILVGGGGGISAIFPWIQALAISARNGSPLHVRFVRVYWSIRVSEAIRWISDSLKELDLASLELDIKLSINLTGETCDAPASACEKTSRVGSTLAYEEVIEGGTIANGRIHFLDIFADLLRDSKTMVIGEKNTLSVISNPN